MTLPSGQNRQKTVEKSAFFVNRHSKYTAFSAILPTGLVIEIYSAFDFLIITNKKTK